MIHDAELLDLFRAESEEHLQSLDEGLMRLETSPSDATTLEQVFRDAHSLKGASRMMGIGTVEEIAHHFEEVLGPASRGQTVLASNVIARLYGALDAMGALVREAISGEPCGIQVPDVLARLNAPDNRLTPAIPADIPPKKLPEPQLETAPFDLQIIASNGVAASSPDNHIQSAQSDVISLNGAELMPSSNRASAGLEEGISPTPLQDLPDPAPTAPPPATSPSSFKIETMRVDPSKLDALLAMAGELVVATTRAARGLGAFEALASLSEEWNKDAAQTRRAMGILEREPAGAHRLMARFAEREAERLEALGALLAKLKTSAEDVARLQGVAGEVESSIRNVRMLPLSTIFNLFARPVSDLAKAQGKDVRLLVEGGDTAADKRILEELKDPLMHLMRNAVDHGLETPDERERLGKPRQATLLLRGRQTAAQVIVELRDDGKGLNIEAIRRSALKKGLMSETELAALSPRQVQELVFAPGFSTAAQITDVSGRGVGLDVVRANVEKLRGTVEVESAAGRGCTFRLVLPVTLATTRVLLVRERGQTFALPVEAVQSLHRVAASEAFPLKGRPTFLVNGRAISLAPLGDLLALPPSEGEAVEPLCVVIAHGGEELGVLVDEVVDEQEIILKPLGALLAKARHVSGATILETGQVCLVLNPGDLLQSGLGSDVSGLPAQAIVAAEPPSPKTILLAEDSITTRTQEKRILERAGYQVVTAVDGLDAWHKLAGGRFDAVVSDVEMPNLDGFSLTARIRGEDQHRELPIILVTSLASDEDRRRGVEAGANAYITKGTFDQKALIEMLRKLA